MREPFDDLLRGVRTEGALFDVARPIRSGRERLPCPGGADLILGLPLRGSGRVAGRAVTVGEAVVVRGPTDELSATGDMTLLVGSCRLAGAVPRRLLRVLPPIVVVPDPDGCGVMRDYLEAQFGSSRPGRRIVRDRMLDWLLVCTLREWFDSQAADAPGWYRALGDEIVGPALRAIHRRPERPWTVAALAAETGVSRTTLARRFRVLVGQAPLAYLTAWRMALAADLLVTDPELTVAAAARRVGYADAFGFSAAFKRVYGRSPSEHRTAPEVAEGSVAMEGTVAAEGTEGREALDLTGC